MRYCLITRFTSYNYVKQFVTLNSSRSNSTVVLPHSFSRHGQPRTQHPPPGPLPPARHAPLLLLLPSPHAPAADATWGTWTDAAPQHADTPPPAQAGPTGNLIKQALTALNWVMLYPN